MRYVYCMMTACLLCGCQGNTTALRNPFATPNRVPPPATRVLQPGSAQPYYPGDALPGTPAGTVFPPGAVGTPVPAYQPVPGSVPPGGWNTSPQSSVTPTPHIFPSSAALAPGQGPPIQVNVDQQNLRFASTPIQAGPGLWNPPQATPQAMVQTAGFQEPVAQVPQSQFAQAPVNPISLNAAPREVRIRAVKSPSVDSGNGSTSGPSQDGFRPQGSRLINRSQPEQRGPAPQQAAAPLQLGPAQENAERFGFDPQYQWLRGQVQYSQTTGQWHLRYISVQEGPDQFGGQVLIENPHLLGGLQPGDYVQVQGRLTAQPGGMGSYAVSIVQRQRVQ